MNQTRIDLLKKYIEEDPNDPFNHYGLACEYISEKPEDALRLLQEISSNFPEYLPTYYQLGKILEQQALEDEALKTYQTGILLATKQGNDKTLRELKAAHQNLIWELEE